MTESQHTYQVTPTTFVYGGEALARLPDGRAVFIPFTLPGEKVLIRLTEDKKRYARGEVVEILEVGEGRIDPRCFHYGECGGCHYQHLPYERQLDVKREVLLDQLSRIGGIADPPVEDTVPSPRPWYYRNRVQFHLSPEGELGYINHRGEDVMPIRECHLLDEVRQAVWPTLEIDAVPGLDRVALRSGEGEEDALLILESSDPQPIEFEVDFTLSAVHRGPGGELVLSGDDFTIVEVLGFPFVVSAEAFFQVNTGTAEQIIEHLLENLPLTDQTVLLDVYCGVGLFSVFLAPEVKKCIGIETSPAAADDFMHNLADFEQVELYQASAEDVLPHLDERPDVILVDPPRGGLSGEALDAITGLGPEVICYISCDPATLARDAKRLAEHGYRLTRSTPFDMFPQTYHIESVNLFHQ